MVQWGLEKIFFGLHFFSYANIFGSTCATNIIFFECELWRSDVTLNTQNTPIGHEQNFLEPFEVKKFFSKPRNCKGLIFGRNVPCTLPRKSWYQIFEIRPISSFIDVFLIFCFKFLTQPGYKHYQNTRFT